VDRDTFDRLILEHLPAAQRFAIRLTGRCDLAEEMVQAALLRAHRSWMSFSGKSSFRTWLLQIIVNAFRDDLRQSAHRTTEPLSPDVADTDQNNPATVAQANELGRVVATAVSTLPPRQREVIVLHAFEQLTDSEIADVLAISPQNVRTTLHLARQRLKEILRPHMNDDHAAR
jgi:RNA polymerase sigma-70 factor, ECF subfamily